MTCLWNSIDWLDDLLIIFSCNFYTKDDNISILIGCCSVIIVDIDLISKNTFSLISVCDLAICFVIFWLLTDDCRKSDLFICLCDSINDFFVAIRWNGDDLVNDVNKIIISDMDCFLFKFSHDLIFDIVEDLHEIFRTNSLTTNLYTILCSDTVAK